MEELDFNSLFEASSGDYAGSVLERLFGGIIPFLKGEAASPGTNLLSDIFAMFNMVGFLGVLVVSSYTIYTVIFDTAADGKTFGQNVNTRHTLMRTLAGAVAFIPVTGGYSIAQVTLLWLMIQASALADVVWTRTADSLLAGESLLAPSGNTNFDDIPVQLQFAGAFDALVNGYICAYNANDIKLTLDGVGPDEPSQGFSGASRSSPMSLRSEIVVSERPHRNLLGVSTGVVDRTRTHQMYFVEDSGTGYGQRQNFCGGVAHAITTTSGGEGASMSFRDAVVTVNRNARFDTYQTVMGTLAGRAQDLAWRIYHFDERNIPALEAQARSAVQEATTGYLSGVRSSLVVPDAQAEALNNELLAMASNQGWMFAPSWQRGIAMAASAADPVAEDFTISIDRNFAVTDYLARTGSGSSVVNSMLAMADDDRITWDMTSSAIMRMGDPEAAATYSALDDSETIDLDAIGSPIYEYLLGLLAVVGGAEEESSIVSDPMVSVSQYGQGLMKIGSFTYAAGWLAEKAANYGPGRVANRVLDKTLGVNLSEAAGTVKWVGVGFIVVGYIVAFIIPLLVFAYFYSAVLSWFLLVLEAFFAIPLAIITLFAPSKDGTLIGSWNQILMSIFGVLLRPFFTVVGMIISMIVISFALSYLYDMFAGMVQMMTPNGAWGLLAMFGFLAVFMLLTFYTVLVGASLITELGDGAMNWLGIGVSALSQRLDMGGRAAGAMQGQLSGHSIRGSMTKTAGALGYSAGRAEAGGKAIAGAGRRAIGRLGGPKGT